MLPVLYRRGLAYGRDCPITICVYFSSTSCILLAPLMWHPTLLVLTVQYEVQLNVPPTTCREGTQEEQGYSSAVDGISGQGYALAA